MAGEGRSSALLLLVMVVCWMCVEQSSAATYIVGDRQGWNLGVNYASWTASKKFQAGDVLVFTYSQMHSVVEVNQAAFSSCTVTPISTYTSGNDSIALSSSKSVQYFICGTPGHCNQGMQLQINISAAASAPAPAPTSSSPPAPASSPSPAPTTPVSSPSPAPGKSPASSPAAETPTTETPASPSSEPTPPSTTTPGAEAPAPTGSSPSSAVEVAGSLVSAAAALLVCLVAL